MANIVEKQAQYVEKAPEMSRGIIARAFDKTASPRAAIKAKCLACCNFARDEITHCTVWTCPLHAYRPFQSGNASGDAASDASGHFEHGLAE